MLQAVEQLDLGLLSVFLGVGDEEDAHAGDGLLLSSCILAVTADASLLAIATASRLLLLPLHGSSPPLPLALYAAERVTALAFTHDARAQDLLIAGFSSGRLSAFSQSNSGAPAWSLTPHVSPIVEVHADAHGAELRLLCLFGDGTIACSASASPPVLLYRLASEGHICRAVASCGVLPLLPLDIPPAGSASEGAAARRFTLVAALDGQLQLHLLELPPHEASSHRTPSSRRGRLVARGIGALNAWLSGGVSDGTDSVASASATRSETESFDAAGCSTPVPKPLQGESLVVHSGDSSLVRAFSDSQRGFITLCIEPRRRRWLAATDILGRVLVLEPRSLVCIRLFKGYRDAQVAWTDAAAAGYGKQDALPLASTEAPTPVERSATDERKALSSPVLAHAAAALLVIYAPRRGLLEAWRMPSGGRVLACNVGGGCILFTPSPSPRTQRTSEGECKGAEATCSRVCYVMQPSGLVRMVKV